MSDPTQVPPFYPSCRVVGGVVTELTGNANAHWADANGCVLITTVDPVTVGWTYDADTGTFTEPPNPTPLPAQEA